MFGGGGGHGWHNPTPFFPQEPRFNNYQESYFASPQGQVSNWKSPQGQISSWSLMRSSRTWDAPKKKVTPQASSVLFSPEELRGGDLTCLGHSNLSWAGCPHLVAMAAQKVPVAMAAKTGVMAMAARNGIPGGWCLQQEYHSPCFQEHFSGVKEKQEPYFLRLRKALPWWEKHAPRETLALIQEGVHPSFPLPDYLESREQRKSAQEEAQALEFLEEYIEVGAVVKDPPGETNIWFHGL